MILARWTLSLHTTNYDSSNGGESNSLWQKPRCALVPFGSYSLGVNRKTSDMDVLVIAPSFCSRQDFFTSLVRLLQEDSLTEEVHPIPFAYTPVIKFVLKGFQIDMLFARVADDSKLLELQRKRASLAGATEGPPPRIEYKIDDSDLTGQDEAGMRSLNGARVSQMLLQYVPDIATYRSVLKAVKEWALRAGIYSNVLGFLGGINCVIMVAWLCKQHPTASKAQLLEHFFETFATWKWPRPVLIAPIQEKPPSGVLHMPAWNPAVNPRDGLQICPIITPAYPSMNSSYNVGVPQLRRIKDEMILACNKLKETNHDYRCLFEPSDFFMRHEHYLQVTINAKNRQDFVEWFRLVESRLRLLINGIETQQVHAWPFARFFDRAYDSTGSYLGPFRTRDENALHESLFFIALRFAPDCDSINLAHLTSDFLFKLNSWEKRKAGMDLKLAYLKSADLPVDLIMDRFDVSGDDDGCSATTTENRAAMSHMVERKSDSSSSEDENNNNNTVKFVISPTKKSRLIQEQLS